MSDKSKELEAQIGEHAQELMRRIEAGPTEAYTQFLRFASRFHTYSFGNQLLILCQNEHATLVAGFNAWLKLKNPVRKGQKGMQIIVPFRKKDDDTGEWKMRGFGVGYVFDVSQTQNPDFEGPSFFTKLGDSMESVYTAVVDAMRGEGIDVDEMERKKGGAEGYSAGGKVRIFGGSPANNKLAVAVHEWAHEINHWGKDRDTFTRQQRECHAESIAFIVCAALGLDISYSADYVINHGNDVKSFQREMDIIQKGAKHILGTLESSKKKKEEVAA